MPTKIDEATTWMEDQDDVPASITEYNIATTANDFNSSTIASFMENGVIRLPFFQRHFVWERARASRLIESLILGLPVPQIFLYEASKNNFLILDGQQRLLSIYFFMKKRFPKREALGLIREKFLNDGTLKEDVLSDDALFENFNLKLPKAQDGKSNKFDGLNYGTLDSNRLSFDLRPIRCITLKQNEPRDDDSSMYEIFDRLNTGGVNLMPQEIRANLYHSAFYTRLYTWDKNTSWRRLLGTSNEDPRMRDVELLLRSFALLIEGKLYKPSMANFLNEFSRHARRFTQPKIDLYDRTFQMFFDINSDLPREALVRQGKLSVAIFESVFIVACQTVLETEGRVSPLKIDPQRLIKLASDPEFTSHLQEGTTKRDHVFGRIERARQVLATPTSG